MEVNNVENHGQIIYPHRIWGNIVAVLTKYGLGQKVAIAGLSHF